MQTNVLPVGSLVDVISYGPFRGLRGSVQTVHIIPDEAEELFCFYLVALEGTQIQKPIWFERDEVEAGTNSSTETLLSGAEDRSLVPIIGVAFHA